MVHSKNCNIFESQQYIWLVLAHHKHIEKNQKYFFQLKLLDLNQQWKLVLHLSYVH